MIMDDGIRIGEIRGRKEGRREGSEFGEKKMATLYEKLQSSGRASEFLQACREESYRKKLMDEFKIE
ncbi:hypothetical protein [Blautia sp.]